MGDKERMRLMCNLTWSISWILTKREGCGRREPKEFSKPQNCTVPASATAVLNFSAKIQKRLHKAMERRADQSAPLGTYLADCGNPRHLQRQQQLPEINCYAQESFFQTSNSRDYIWPLKIRCSQAFSDNPVISRAAPLHEELHPWGLGVEASWKHLLCWSEAHVTYQTDQDTEGNWFLSDISGNSYCCQVYSKYNSLACEAFPWP